MDYKDAFYPMTTFEIYPCKNYIEENMRLRNALEHIASLDLVTEWRGELDIRMPESWVNGLFPIHPLTRKGLSYAARIAKRALK